MNFSRDVFRRRIVSGLTSGEPDAAKINERQPEPGSDTVVDLSDLCSIPSDEEFVKRAYRAILGRAYDVGGLVYWQERLRALTPRRVVLLEILNSTEALQRRVRFTGIPGAPTTPTQSRLRSLLERTVGLTVGRLCEGVRRVRLSPFRSLDQKLSLVLREISMLAEKFSEKTDQVQCALLAQLDAYHSDLRNRQRRLGAGLDSLAQRMQSVATNLERMRDMEKRQDEIIDQIATVRVLIEKQTGHCAFGFKETGCKTVMASKTVIATEVDGFIVGVPAEEWRMAAYHVFRGLPEPGTMKRFQQLLRPGMVVVDVGANVGLYTLEAARALTGKGRVYTFEPTPRTFRMLQDNIQVNGFLETDIVELHQMAVTDRLGRAELALFADNCGHNTLFFDGEMPHISVSTISLDEALKAGFPVDVVKIDAEGAEPLIIRGMRDIIRRSPKIHILVEFAPVHLRRAGFTPSEFISEIESLELEIHRIHDETGLLMATSADELSAVWSTNLELCHHVISATKGQERPPGFRVGAKSTGGAC
jgi:FkbM family methyltransferase